MYLIRNIFYNLALLEVNSSYVIIAASGVYVSFLLSHEKDCGLLNCMRLYKLTYLFTYLLTTECGLHDQREGE